MNVWHCSNILKERESKIPEIQDALDKQRQVTMKQQEELLFKSQRIETLQSALEQMQFALDRTQNMMSEREARLQLLQASLDNSQPAMSIARKAIEERDMKLNAFQVLLHMGESQVQENVKALDQAMQSLKDKDENLKQLQAMIDERDLRIGDMETTLGQSRNEMAEKDWQVSARTDALYLSSQPLYLCFPQMAAVNAHAAPKSLNIPRVLHMYFLYIVNLLIQPGVLCQNQINAHESKISDLHEKLHSIDREHASESVNQGVASASRMLNDSINDVTAPDDYDRVQVRSLHFM